MADGGSRWWRDFAHCGVDIAGRYQLLESAGPDSGEGDLERLSREERAALAENLLGWVAAGPPRANRRSLAGIEAFEDRVPPGLEVAYFVDEPEAYVAILRVRKGWGGAMILGSFSNPVQPHPSPGASANAERAGTGPNILSRWPRRRAGRHSERRLGASPKAAA